MSGVTPSSTSRGFIACTAVYLAIASLYTAVYDGIPWMWFGWSVLAIVTAVLLVTDN
ncbi:hypothetical protein [Yinghuangia soli]|uniref:Uncharacterized protein n=1 Tax=Yinghuangia soli TaxID=2908204 RepID=A0AA41Q733_9ACTN|nr:hypothetical protein [Yinghuangia soli]MCF2531579.1 hypothetical protein [Yinghuangia soli]